MITEHQQNTDKDCSKTNTFIHLVLLVVKLAHYLKA